MSDHDSQLAQGILTIAIRRLAKSQPFHAQLLAQVPFIAAPEVGTLGVTVRDAQLQLHYAPQFVCRCGFDELAEMLEHLVDHVPLRHHLASPADLADAQGQIGAEKVTANESITAPLPDASNLLGQIRQLPPSENPAPPYAHLVRETGRSVSKKLRSVPKNDGSVPKMAASGRNKQRSNARTHAELLDNHVLWQEAQQHPQLSRLVIANALRRAEADPGRSGLEVTLQTAATSDRRGHDGSHG